MLLTVCFTENIHMCYMCIYQDLGARTWKEAIMTLETILRLFFHHHQISINENGNWYT